MSLLLCLGLLRKAFLLGLCRAFHVCSVDTLLYLLLAHRHDSLAVNSHVHGSVAVVHNSLLIGDNGYALLASVWGGQRIAVAKGKWQCAVHIVCGLLCHFLPYCLRCRGFLLFWVNGIINVEDSVRSYLLHLASLSITYYNGIVRFLSVNTAAVVRHHHVTTDDVHILVCAVLILLFQRSRVYHAVGAVHMAVNGMIAFFHTAVNVVTHTLQHSLVCRLGVGIVYHRLESCRVAQSALLVNVVQRVANVVIHLVSVLYAQLLCQLPTLHVKQVLGIVHGFWLSRVVSTVITLVITCRHRVLLTVLQLAFLRTGQSLVFLCCLHKVQHTHTEAYRQVSIVHYLTQCCRLLLVSANKECVTPTAPFLHPMYVAAYGMVNGFASLTHFIHGLSFRATVGECLGTRQEAAHERHAEECVNVLVKVEYTCILGCVERVVTNKQGILNIAHNLLGILADCAVPFGVLLKIAYHLGKVGGTHVVNKAVHTAKPHLVHAFSDYFRCLAEQWGKVFAHHFRVVLYGLCAKCLEKSLCHTVLCSFSAAIHDMPGFVLLELNIASQTVQCVCRHMTKSRGSCHDCRTCGIANQTSANLCCQILFSGFLHCFLTETLDSFLRHSLYSSLAKSRCRVEYHLQHKR